ncbi:hypothetical protein [Plesiocystis pacifica]|nr:hypothetical protein [Plesiocystis pacifica]
MHYMDMPQAAWPRAQRALLDFEVGEPARGETGLVEALTLLGEHWEQADPRRIPLLLDIAAGLLERGQPALAGTVLERAALLAGPVHESFGVRARIDRLRAQVARAAGDDARALELLNEAYLGTDGDFGMGHPELDRLNLERADLAWSLGDRAFAERLYGTLKDHDLDPLGPEAAARVRSRAP